MSADDGSPVGSQLGQGQHVIDGRPGREVRRHRRPADALLDQGRDQLGEQADERGRVGRRGSCLAGFGDVGAVAGPQSLAQRRQVGLRAGAWPQLDGVERGPDACGGTAECLPAGVQGGPVRVVDLAGDPDGDRPAAHGQGEPVAYPQADLGEKFGVDVHLARGAEPVAADHRPAQPGEIAVIGHEVQVRQASFMVQEVSHAN